MVMSVDSPENKGLLWNVLLENGSFAGIPETKIGEVNVMLDVVVEEVVGMDGIAPTMESNKRVLAEMARRLREYGETNPAPTTHTTNREDLQKERIDRMNDMAKKMSADMARYEPKKPKSVRFSDDVDKLSPELLESRLAQAISLRKLDVVGVGGNSTSDTVLPIPTQSSPLDMKSPDEEDIENMHQDVHQDMHQDMHQDVYQDVHQDMRRMYNEMKTMYGEMKQLMTELKK